MCPDLTVDVQRIGLNDVQALLDEIKRIENIYIVTRHALDSILDGIESLATQDGYPQDKFSSFDPVDYVGWLLKELASRDEIIKKLGEALERYGIHESSVCCEWEHGCQCGLNAALSLIEKKESQ